MTRRFLFLIPLVIAGVLLALVLLPPLAALFPSLAGIAAFSYFAFHPVCHQLPERSFALFGALFPVCARCTGLYAGFFSGWLLWTLLPESSRQRPLSNLTLAAGLSPLVIDGLANAAGILTTPPLVRTATGMLFAAVAARALATAFLQVWEETMEGNRSRATRFIQSPRPQIHLRIAAKRIKPGPKPQPEEASIVPITPVFPGKRGRGK